MFHHGHGMGFLSLYESSGNHESHEINTSHALLRNAVGDVELDGVGPVDNRPSTDKLHHFVKKNITRDM